MVTGVAYRTSNPIKTMSMDIGEPRGSRRHPTPAGEGAHLEAPPEAVNMAQMGVSFHQTFPNLQHLSRQEVDLPFAKANIERALETHMTPSSHVSEISAMRTQFSLTISTSKSVLPGNAPCHMLLSTETTSCTIDDAIFRLSSTTDQRIARELSCPYT